MQRSKNIFGFKKQLQKGNKGENLFIKLYKDLNPKKNKNRDFDILINDKESVELKTDYYSMSKTPNFFFERYRNSETKKPGSVWQSINCDFFIYFFIKEKTFFWFKTKELRDFLNDEIKKYQPKQIRNYGWSCIGYCIPREVCKHLIIREDKF